MTDPTITPDQVLQYLEDVDYPAGKEVLVAAAERAGAPEAVVRSLRAIPPVEYRSRAEVDAVGARRPRSGPVGEPGGRAGPHACPRGSRRAHARAHGRTVQPHPSSAGGRTQVRGASS